MMTTERDYPTVKCLVWDLDNTLWSGTLLERDEIRLHPAALAVITTLDSRGIVHSIASRNDTDSVIAKLNELGIVDYFVCPQVSWGSKVDSIRRICMEIGISPDTIAFIDDQELERAEVAHALPAVRCFASHQISDLPAMRDFTPRVRSPEAPLRRQMYQAEAARRSAQEDFDGTLDEFQAELHTHVTIRTARASDLARVEELTLRTNQLNSTGYTYSQDELERLASSSNHMVLLAELTDRFGPYGTVALALVQCNTTWTIRLLLVSCRVISRGVGTILMKHLVELAVARGVQLFAEFIETNRNRLMFIVFRQSGFQEIERRDGVTLLEHSLAFVPQCPRHVVVSVES